MFDFIWSDPVLEKLVHVFFYKKNKNFLVLKYEDIVVLLLLVVGFWLFLGKCESTTQHTHTHTQRERASPWIHAVNCLIPFSNSNFVCLSHTNPPFTDYIICLILTQPSWDMPFLIMHFYGVYSPNYNIIKTDQFKRKFKNIYIKKLIKGLLRERKREISQCGCFLFYWPNVLQSCFKVDQLFRLGFVSEKYYHFYLSISINF